MGRLPVEEVGVACVAAALLAAARLSGSDAELDGDHVRAALVSERLFRVDGAPAGGGFAPQSRFWRAADGWVRTHANFPWHHEALLRAVGAADDEGLEDAIAARPARQIEDDVFAAGGVAAAVRTPTEWRGEPAGASVASEPLVAHLRLGDADPRPLLRCAKSGHTTDNEHRKGPDAASTVLRSELSGGDTDSPEDDDVGGAALPATGVRVLDLTRVIAGPVCGRYLGALGADVLRLDPPHLPDLEPGSPADTLLGKRSAFLDLRDDAAARRLEELLGRADIVLLGYRPGALARFGLAPEDLAARHPGLVIAQLSAWGHTGPWAERRGFDSIVQAAGGIAAVEADADGAPGALPCQLLDHGTGYLTAAAVLGALVEQREIGGTHLLRLSLARTAHWLLEGARSEAAGESGVPDRPAAVGESAVPDQTAAAGESGVPEQTAGTGSAASRPAPELDEPPWHEPGAAFVGPVRADPSLAAVPPPGSLAGRQLGWSRAARYGADEAAW